MVLFGLETEKSEKVLKWFSQTQKRGDSENMVKNPFKVKMKFFIDEKTLLAINIEPLYPNVPILGWITLIGMYFLFGLKWYLVFPFFIGCLVIFWSTPFYYIMAVRGIRKAGYKGPIKFASKKRIIEGAIF